MGCEQRKRLVNCRNDFSRRNAGPTDQVHRESEHTRRFNFRYCCHAAGVFSKNRFDAMGAEQRDVIGSLEWPARFDDRRVRHRQRRDQWVNDANDVVVLRREAQGAERQPPETREYARGFGGERSDRSFDACVMLPAIARLSPPLGPLERNQRHASPLGGRNGVSTDLSCKRMRRVEKHAYLMVNQIGGQSVDSTKAAAASRNRNLLRRGGAPRERQDGIEPCVGGEAFAQRPRFTRAAKHKHPGKMTYSDTHGPRQ